MASESRSNPWLERPQFHWAHQGGAREAPSNTIYAMKVALKTGADGLEFDVHRTKDGHVVLMHDKTLRRTTNAEVLGFPAAARIKDCRLEDLSILDAAYWWVPGQVDDRFAPDGAYVLRGDVADDPTLGVPTLDAVLREFRGPFTIEVKDKRAARAVISLLRNHEVPGTDVIVTSFRLRTVWNLRWRILRTGADIGLAPAALSTLLFFIRSRRGGPGDRLTRRSPYVAIQPPAKFAFADLPAPYSWIGRLLPLRWRAFTVVDERFLACARAAGLAVHVWTINGRSEMQELTNLGVHGIMTDCPTELVEAFRGGDRE